MKLDLKPPEHVRLQHDSEGGAFRIYIERGMVHITAMPPDEQRETAVVIADPVKIER